MNIKIKKGQPTVDLTLSLPYREAMLLHTIFESIGGSPAGPRRLVSQLCAAFTKAGVDSYASFGSTMDLPHSWAELKEEQD